MRPAFTRTAVLKIMSSALLLFVVLLAWSVGQVTSQCYTTADCTGDTVPVSGEVACCAESDDGQSYHNGEDCIACIVHGFERASYDIEEGQTLSLELYLNVKGGTRTSLVLNGAVTVDPVRTTDSSDYKQVMELGVIILEAKTDLVSLEYDESLTLTFTPNDESFSSDLSTGEYLRLNTTINILDGNSLQLELQSCDYYVTEESELLQPILVFYSGATQNDFTLTFRAVNISSAADLLTSPDSTDPAFIATPGADFFETNITVFVPRSDYIGSKEIEVSPFLELVDDDINEVEQRFAIVAELGDEVRSGSGCFQKQSMCSRTDAVEINIRDNDPMFVGFTERRTNISERTDVPVDVYRIAIEVSTERTSELIHTSTIYVVESKTATVESFSSHSLFYDALFGTIVVPGDPLQEVHLLRSGERRYQDIQLSIRNDFLIENEECFTLSISTRNHFGQEALCNADDDSSASSYFCEHTICIEDDDEPFVVEFVKTDYTVLESAGSVEVCVNLTRPLVDILDENLFVNVVDFSISSAIPHDSVLATPDRPNPQNGVYLMDNSTDYAQQTLLHNEIDDQEIWALMRVVCYDQTIYDDQSVEGDEYAGLSLSVRQSTITTYNVRPLYDQAAILIIDDDDDVAVVGLEKTVQEASEEDGVVEVCVRVLSPDILCPIQFPFSVVLSSNDGSAERMLDYEPFSVVVQFESCETRRCVNISILSDLIEEPDESFNYTLERTPDLDSRISLDPVEGEVVIVGQCPGDCDGDLIVVGFEHNVAASENVGVAMVSVSVMNASGAARPFSLSLSTRDGTARAPQDYQLLTDEIIQFNMGDARMTHLVVIHQNRICDRDNEFFYVDLTVRSGTFPILLSPSSAQVSIADIIENECDISVGIERAFVEVSEDMGLAQVCVILTYPGSGCATEEFNISVDIRTTDGSAVKSQDYAPLFSTVQFESCETRKCVTISIVSDLIEEPDESFNYTLERTPDLDSRISLDSVEGEVVIVGQCPGDCDGVPIVVGFESTAYTTSESEGTVELSVVVTDPSMGGAPRPFSLSVYTADGTAMSSDDYRPIGNEILQFNTGDERVGYTVVISNDSICERSSEEFFLELSLYSGALPINVSQSKVRIVIGADSIETDCKPVVGLERDFYNADRDDVVAVCITVSSPDIVCPVEFPFSVRVETADGNAVSTLDYGPVSEELIFEACETLKCVNISIVVYETYEPEPYEGFEINILKTPDLDPSIVLDPVKARVGIPGGCLGSCDYRAPILVGFESSTYTTSESDGMVEVAIAVTGGAPQPLSVSLRTENNTAFEMEDYTSVNEVIQFDLGDERKVYNLRITEDQRCEDILESFNIDLFLYEGIVPVIKSTAQVFIRDTRCVAVVGLEETRGMVSEDVGTVQVCIAIAVPDVDCPIQLPFDVLLSTASGRAESTSDYLPVSVIVPFRSCQTRQCVNISIVSDLIDEVEENFTITLERTPDLYARISLDPVEQEIVILPQCHCGCNRVPIVVGFESTAYTTSESEGMVELSVVVTDPAMGGAPRPFSLSVSKDQSLSNSVEIVQFQRGDERLVINMTILQDEICEGPQSLTAQISLYSGVHPMTMSQSTTEVVIDDCAEHECVDMLAQVGCISNEPSPDLSPTPSETNTPPTSSPSPTQIPASSLLYVYAIVPIGFLLLVALVALVAAVIYVRLRKKKLALPFPGNHAAGSVIANTEGTFQPLNDVFEEIRMKVNKGMLFTKDQIRLSKVVGQGETGVVYKAFLDTSDGTELVAIKTVKVLFASSDVTRLIKEINLMATFNHPNVMTLRGVCLDQENPLLMMPFMNNGTLLEYIRQHKDNLMLNDEADPLKISSAKKLMLGMCFQVAKGMQYLTEQRVVHRDLAARNCMIDVNGVIKVADFGLTEDMYATNYFRKEYSESGNDEKVPIRWMAPESISGELYNEKTDVWSFGVTCWEVFTCGQVPYHGIPVTRLWLVLATGERLDKPANAACSDEIFHIISSCWLEAPEERPKFLHLVQEISSILEAEAGYLDLSICLVWKKQEDTAGDTKPLSEKTRAKENLFDTAM